MDTRFILIVLRQIDHALLKEYPARLYGEGNTGFHAYASEHPLFNHSLLEKDRRLEESVVFFTISLISLKI